MSDTLVEGQDKIIKFFKKNYLQKHPVNLSCLIETDDSYKKNMDLDMKKLKFDIFTKDGLIYCYIENVASMSLKTENIHMIWQPKTLKSTINWTGKLSLYYLTNDNLKLIDCSCETFEKVNISLSLTFGN